MWPFNKRNWILVIGESDPEHLFTDIECISTKRYECVNEACRKIFDWIYHKKEDFGGKLINSNIDLPADTDDWFKFRENLFKFREKLYEVLTQWTEDFQDTANLELTWKTSHLEIYKISVRIFSSTSDFIRLN